MAINFPTSLDSLTNPTSTDPQTLPSHSAQHDNVNDAVEALEAKVGVNSSAVTTSLDYKVGQLQSSILTSTLGYAQAVASQTGLDSSTYHDLTSLSIAVTVGASRRIRIHGHTIIGSLSAYPNTVILAIREGATVLQQGQRRLFDAGQDSLDTFVVLTPSTGAHTYKLSMTVTGGTVSSEAGATFPAFILVEDIGT